jgi:hypothetical protein
VTGALLVVRAEVSRSRTSSGQGAATPPATHTYVVRTMQQTRSPTRTVNRAVALVRPTASVSASTVTVSPQRADDDHSSVLALTSGSIARSVNSSHDSPAAAHQTLDASSAQVR